jgi:FkbM family methyltransferase
MGEILRRTVGYLTRVFAWCKRALRNPAVGNIAVLFAGVPQSLWVTSSTRRSLFGIRVVSRDGTLAVFMPGVGWLALPFERCVPQALAFWALDVAVLDGYEATRFLKNGMVAVDVGANVGAFSLLASRLVGRDGKVLALEPVPENYRCLCRTLGLNRLANVAPFELAIGDTRGSLRLSLSDNPGGHSAVLDRGDQHIEVPMATLDEVCAEQELERLDFLKIDVEGFEPEVVRGARESLARFRPVIAAAAYHLPGHRELLPALIREMVPDYEIRVAPAAPGLELKCLAVPRERLAAAEA